MNKCLNCGKETKNKKFCSRKCCGPHILKQFQIEIQIGKLGGKGRKWSEDTRRKTMSSLLKRIEKKRKKLIETIPFEKLPKELIKKIVREEIGNKCERCGYEYTDPIFGKGPYEIHHKDENKNNWKRENLEVICLNCHWKTGNYKFKNRRHTDKTKKLISKNNYYRKKD